MKAGQRIGPFEIEKELGSGAMGTVYRALYSRSGQDVAQPVAQPVAQVAQPVAQRVAIKIISAGLGGNQRAQERFEREVSILKQLHHPNIVRIVAGGKVGRTPFYAMEYVEGETLDTVLQRRDRFTWEEVVEIGKQLCAALEHAHEKGIVHRDLKPTNLMITRDGTLKLTDFGIAKDLDRTGLTSAHCTVGTAAYMSPEQCRGDANLTHKSDLYSLGIMLYELLTGRKPFHAENVVQMFKLHAEGKFERPSRIALEIPVWLDTLVCQLLEKKPEHRPLDAATVARALGEVKEKVDALKSAGVEVARQVAKAGEGEDRELARTLLKPFRKKPRKKKTNIELWLKAGGMVVLLAGIVVAVIFGLRPPSAEKILAKGAKLVEQGERLIEAGDPDQAQATWYDAEHKYLAELAGGEGPLAEQARQQLDHIRAGTLYLKGRRWMNGENGRDWKKAKSAGFDELLDKYASVGTFADKARGELQPFEAPDLLSEARRALTDPKATIKEKDEASARLKLLLARYPRSDEAETAQMFVAEQDALVELEEARKANRLPASANRAKELALEALNFELDRQGDQARHAWKKLLDWGGKTIQLADGEKRPLDMPEYRPWLLLAREKLRRKD